MNEEKMNKIVGQKKKTALSMQGAEVYWWVSQHPIFLMMLPKNERKKKQ